MGPRFDKQAALIYGLMAVAAALWSGLRGWGLPVSGGSPLREALLGVAVAASTVLLGMLTYRLLPSLRKLADELAPHLIDPADRTGLVLISGFSGLAEEMFFRGAVQQSSGCCLRPCSSGRCISGRTGATWSGRPGRWPPGFCTGCSSR